MLKIVSLDRVGILYIEKLSVMLGSLAGEENALHKTSTRKMAQAFYECIRLQGVDEVKGIDLLRR